MRNSLVESRDSGLSSDSPVPSLPSEAERTASNSSPGESHAIAPLSASFRHRLAKEIENPVGERDLMFESILGR